MLERHSAGNRLIDESAEAKVQPAFDLGLVVGSGTIMSPKEQCPGLNFRYVR